MTPSLSHFFLGLLIYLSAVLFVKFLPIYFIGVYANILYWGGRELAQSMRPSDPGGFKWSWSNTRNFLFPVVGSLALAVGLWLFL